MYVESLAKARRKRNAFSEEFNILAGGEKYVRTLTLVEDPIVRRITLDQQAKECDVLPKILIHLLHKAYQQSECETSVPVAFRPHFVVKIDRLN